MLFRQKLAKAAARLRRRIDSLSWLSVLGWVVRKVDVARAPGVVVTTQDLCFPDA